MNVAAFNLRSGLLKPTYLDSLSSFIFSSVWCGGFMGNSSPPRQEMFTLPMPLAGRTGESVPLFCGHNVRI